MIITHNIQTVTFDENFMYLTIDGKEIIILLEKVSKKLQVADQYQRMLFKISPSGYGIHWPLIDEDLAIDALLRIA